MVSPEGFEPPITGSKPVVISSFTTETKELESVSSAKTEDTETRPQDNAVRVFRQYLQDDPALFFIFDKSLILRHAPIGGTST